MTGPALPDLVVFDVESLRRQTGGDAQLERDVLAMFSAQVPGEARQLADADGEAQKRLAHRIVGSARAVGAMRVAAAAEAVEAGCGPGGAQAESLTTLQAEIGAFCDAISDYLGERE